MLPELRAGTKWQRDSSDGSSVQDAIITVVAFDLIGNLSSILIKTIIFNQASIKSIVGVDAKQIKTLLINSAIFAEDQSM